MTSKDENGKVSLKNSREFMKKSTFLMFTLLASLMCPMAQADTAQEKCARYHKVGVGSLLIVDSIGRLAYNAFRASPYCELSVDQPDRLFCWKQVAFSLLKGAAGAYLLYRSGHPQKVTSIGSAKSIIEVLKKCGQVALWAGIDCIVALSLSDTYNHWKSLLNDRVDDSEEVKCGEPFVVEDDEYVGSGVVDQRGDEPWFH